MSIGPDARRWFLSKYGETKNKVYTSKYYLPEESWPKTHVWWPQIPMSAIDKSKYTHVNILCQVAPDKIDFHYFKVPTSYLNENLEKFDKVGDKIHLYLSAESHDLFTETRGTGNLNFSKFFV
jgi:hypothetical protein